MSNDASYRGVRFKFDPAPLTLENVQRLADVWGVPGDVLPGESIDAATDRIRNAVLEVVRGKSESEIKKKASPP